MTLTIRLIKLFLFSSTVLGSSFSVVKSYETLKNRSEPTHATPHINNLIRNGLGQLNKDERDKLDEIGLRIVGNRITTMDPMLDQTYDTEHFRFFYTLQDNDAVENIDYVLTIFSFKKLEPPTKTLSPTFVLPQTVQFGPKYE